MARKKKVCITIDEELIHYLLEGIKERRFASLSHAISYAIFKLMKEEKTS